VVLRHSCRLNLTEKEKKGSEKVVNTAEEEEEEEKKIFMYQYFNIYKIEKKQKLSK
jgi:hypothetical protein